MRNWIRVPVLLLMVCGVLAAEVPEELTRLSRRYVGTGKQQDRAELLAYVERTSAAEEQALARFALGMGDFKAEAFRDGVEQFRKAGQGGPLADYVRYYHAKSLAGAEEFAEAAKLIADFPQKFPQSLLAGDAVRLQVESLIRAGKHKQAQELLDASKKTLSAPVRLFLTARTEVLAGNLKAAVRTYRRVYYHYPLSDQADPAEEALNDLRRRLGSAYPAAPSAWRLQRADALYGARQYTNARAEYGRALDGLKGADLDRARMRAGASDYRRLRTSAAYAALSKLKVADPDVDAERLYYLSQCARRKNLIGQFTGTAEELGRKYPRSPWYEEALFSLGNYYLLENNGRKYREYYGRAASEFPEGKYAELAHWKVCWRAYLDGDPRAAALLEEHRRRFPRSPQTSAALYWLARLAEKGGDVTQARVVYSAITERFPLYYYGYRAAERLEELQSSVDIDGAAASFPYLQGLPAIPSRADKPSPATARLLARGRLLFDLGLDELAERELRSGSYGDSDSHLLGLTLAEFRADRGEFHRGLRYMKLYARGYLRMPLDSMQREFWERLFPMPFSDELRSYAARHRLDPYMVAGLIRQESEFNPTARSRAGARGLMQIMPSTGRLLARKAGLGRFSTRRLYMPELSLRLGTLHLRNVLDQFENSLELTLAAYNAGEHRVEEWITWGDFREPGTFVETIPFTETRGYVQGVLRNMAVYRALYGEPPELSTPSRAALSAQTGSSSQ